MKINIDRLDNVYIFKRKLFVLSDSWQNEDISLFEFLAEFKKNIQQDTNVDYDPIVTIEYEGTYFKARLYLQNKQYFTNYPSIIELQEIKAKSLQSLLKKLSGLDIKDSYKNIEAMLKLENTDEEYLCSFPHLMLIGENGVGLVVVTQDDSFCLEWDKKDKSSFYELFNLLDVQLQQKENEYVF